MMQLGAEGVFVGSGIFKSEDPERTAQAIVEATTHFEDAERVAARLARPRRGDDRARDLGARASPAGLPPADARLVTGRRPRPPGRLRGARQGPPRARRRAARGAHAGGPRRARRAGDPRRRVDHDDARHRARGPRRAAARPCPERHADARHLRRPDHARPRPPRPARRHRPPQRLRAPGAIFEADLELDGTSALCARSSSARPWVEEHGRGSRGAGRDRRPPGRGAPGQHPRRRVPPGADRRRALHAWLLERSARA